MSTVSDTAHIKALPYAFARIHGIIAAKQSAQGVKSGCVKM
jgi:hypothetical protein